MMQGWIYIFCYMHICKYVSIFTCMSLPTCLYSTCKLRAHWGQKRTLDVVELESQMIVTTMRLLGIEPGPSATFKMEVIGNRNLLSLRSESPMLRLHTLDQQRLIPKWPVLITSLTEDAQPSPKPKPLKCQLKIIVVIIIRMRRPQPEPLVHGPFLYRSEIPLTLSCKQPKGLYFEAISWICRQWGASANATS